MLHAAVVSSRIPLAHRSQVLRRCIVRSGRDLSTAKTGAARVLDVAVVRPPEEGACRRNATTAKP